MSKAAADHGMTPCGNGFLQSLSPCDLNAIAPMLQLVSCRRGERLAVHGASDREVYFPISLVASLSMPSSKCGIGLVGREGVIGWGAILGLSTPDFEARVMFEGGAVLAGSVSRLRDACFSRPTLAMSLLKFAQGYILQIGCTAHSGACASLGQRLGAWLLMVHDRIDGDFISITHGQLASHLDVRRASITDTLHLLEGTGALRCKRGMIAIRDRPQLEKSAGMAYRGGPSQQAAAGMSSAPRVTLKDHAGAVRQRIELQSVVALSG